MYFPQTHGVVDDTAIRIIGISISIGEPEMESPRKHYPVSSKIIRQNEGFFKPERSGSCMNYS
jgi:hypothetical protein